MKEDKKLCADCGHSESDHDTSGCHYESRSGCDCDEFIDPDTWVGDDYDEIAQQICIQEGLNVG